ncbi:MAG TPA: MBL fold metallo-hydrolase [Gemmatimonadaceae bacterium]|nr:MBL fold metallo-hydrolase [Gemmatimonadaceae bacterium]
MTSGRASVAPLTVKILDVGQGDAILIENGGSRVLIDGGPDERRMGDLLDSLHLNDSTFDVVILSHQHADHLVGLRALFESARHITVRFFFENQDPYTAANLRHLRDSVIARVTRGQTIYRDTDDPCANGQPLCTITLKGGAKLHIMRPYAGSKNPNDRSAPVKLVGPDSASFTMWLAGDAEHDATDWFVGDAHYDRDPGIHVNVLKADHHGSCNGVNDAYLDAVRPDLAVVSVGAVNSYGHMHEQAKAEYAAHQVPWYRTDQNGTIVLNSPGMPRGGYSIAVQRGTKNMAGPSDKHSTQKECKLIR